MTEVSQAAKYVGEFVGTYMLVLTVGCNVLTGGSPIWVVTSIASTLSVMIYALGGISGANFNPAVSLALGITGDLDFRTASIYMVCQTLGGIFAGLTYNLVFSKTFNLAPAPGFHLLQAGAAELIYTFMLCFVVLNVACSKDKGNQYYGMAIGFVVIAGGYGAGSVSGGCFNPAVAFGIDISSLGFGFGWCLVYMVFEFLGAAGAAMLYQSVRAHEKTGEAPSQRSKWISEFVGTYILVMTVGLNVIGGSKAPVFSIAASLMCMIYALGSVSGAHFNPAVTLCLCLTNRPDVFKPADAPMYMLVQMWGGILSGVTYMAMMNGRSFPLGPGKDYSLGQAFFAEVLFTAMLCYVVCCVATVKKGPLTQFFGLAIASCVTAGGYAIGGISGGSLNPAVSFGIAAGHIVNGGGIIHAIDYMIFEFVGAILAANLFLYTHASDPSLTKSSVEVPLEVSLEA